MKALLCHAALSRPAGPSFSADIREQRQIKTALEHGLGAPRAFIGLEARRGRTESFKGLVKSIIEHTGIKEI